MIRSRHIPLLGITVLFLLLMTGCSRSYVVELDSSSWQVGDTTWFSFTTLDSVLGPDSAYERGRGEKLIRYSVLEKGEGAIIEWQEFFQYHDPDLPLSDVEWSPSYRLIYATGRSGEVRELLNYPEVRAYADTMSRLYMGMVDVAAADGEKILKWALDSTRLISRLMNEPELLHTGRGLVIAVANGRVTTVAHPRNRYGLLELELDEEADLDGLAHVRITGQYADKYTGGSLSLEELPPVQSPYLDSLAKGIVHLELMLSMSCDTVADLPTYVESHRCTDMQGLRMKRSTIVERL